MKLTQKIKKITNDISVEYKNRDLELIGILKGSFMFTAYLARELTIPAQIDFVGASSYGSGNFSSENIIITKEIQIDIKNKDVLILEDIVDTGLTLSHIIKYIESFSPYSIKIFALLNKHERRKNYIKVDYECFTIPKGFIIGYGIDYAENYRLLPKIYKLKK